MDMDMDTRAVAIVVTTDAVAAVVVTEEAAVAVVETTGDNVKMWKCENVEMELITSLEK